MSHDKSKPLQLRPHYSDPRFNEEQAVFGCSEKGLFYNYSDRLWQADYTKSRCSERLSGVARSVLVALARQ